MSVEKVTVSVDRDFARFGSKSYAINKINTVDVRSRHPHGQSGLVMCILAGIISVFFGPVGWVLMLVFGALGYWAWRKSQIVEYRLYLVTSSSEAEAITSKDRDYITNIREHIEAAMAGRMT